MEGVEGSTHRLTVAEGEVGRLDSFIAEQLALSRTRVQKLLASGMVLLDGQPAKKSDAVSAGAVVEIQVPRLSPLPVVSIDRAEQTFDALINRDAVKGVDHDLLE